MSIRKILQSDWLDCAMWTIYTLPYRRSGPFVRLLITIKTRVGKMANKVSAEDHEMIDMFGKSSANFQKNLKRYIVTFWQSIPSICFQHKFSQNFPDTSEQCSEYFSQAINSLITGWTVYTKNINPSVFRIDLPAVGLYVRTSGFIFFCTDSPTSYYGDSYVEAASHSAVCMVQFFSTIMLKRER